MSRVLQLVPNLARVLILTPFPSTYVNISELEASLGLSGPHENPRRKNSVTTFDAPRSFILIIFIFWFMRQGLAIALTGLNSRCQSIRLQLALGLEAHHLACSLVARSF